MHTLKEYRESLGLTAEQAAKRLGVSRQQLSKWENGHAKPTIPTQEKFMEAYCVVFHHTRDGLFVEDEKTYRDRMLTRTDGWQGFDVTEEE